MKRSLVNKMHQWYVKKQQKVNQTETKTTVYEIQADAAQKKMSAGVRLCIPFV